jgi:uncharacterized protein HemY
MLVVEPPAVRYDHVDVPSGHEEHLLERVSALEYRLARMTGRLEQSLDLLLRQARNTYFDHALLETLVGVLGETRVVPAEKLEARWHERCRRDAAEQNEIQRREDLRAEMIARYQGTELETFKRLIDEGMNLLASGDQSRGVRALERAAALAADNARLNSFLGEHYFRKGKTAIARDYLERAKQVSPGDDRISLLLALACGDEGDAERAKYLLRRLADHGVDSFAVHYALGRLFALEEKWIDALAAFKNALAARPSPETHYVLGCVYYRLNRNRMASRHLRKAIELDEGYSAALYMLGLVFLRTGNVARAEEAFRTARDSGQDEARYRQSSILNLQPDEAPALPPLFSTTRNARKRLVTSGDRRLAQAVREDALNGNLQRA